MKRRQFLFLLTWMLMDVACTGVVDQIFSTSDDSSSTLGTDASDVNISNGATDDSAGSTEGSDSSDSELDSEGFASLPVTPPKAIDALGMSVTSSSSVQNTHDWFMSTLLADDTEGSSSCYLVGAADTVEADAEMQIGIKGSEDVAYEFTSESDGSFYELLPADFGGKDLWMRYVDADDSGQNISVKIDTSCATYALGINESSGSITGEMAVYDSTIYYNQAKDNGKNAIMMQNMSGSEPAEFAETDSALSQMFYYTEDVVQDFLDSDMLLGVDADLNLVRVSDNVVEILNDHQNGDVITGGTGIYSLTNVIHAPQQSGQFSVFFGRHESGINSPLALIPTVPEAQDYSINNDTFNNIYDRSMSWIDEANLLCINQYLLSSSGTGDSQSSGNAVSAASDGSSGSQEDVFSAIEIFDLNAYTALDTDDFTDNSEAIEQIPAAYPSKIFHSSKVLKLPRTSPAETKSDPYFIFDVKKNIQADFGLAISNYTSAKIITDYPGTVMNKSISQYGDMLAIEVEMADAINIQVIHLPSMTTAWIINPDLFDESMALIKPVFSQVNPYALSYQIKYDDGKIQVGVLNLARSPFFKQILDEKGGQTFTLSSIFDNDSYETIPLEEVDTDAADADADD